MEINNLKDKNKDTLIGKKSSGKINFKTLQLQKCLRIGRS